MPFAYIIRVMFVRMLIITHSDRALFNLNALVSSLGAIVPSAYGLGHYDPSSLNRAYKLNSALSGSHYVLLLYYNLLPSYLDIYREIIEQDPGRFLRINYIQDEYTKSVVLCFNSVQEN